MIALEYARRHTETQELEVLDSRLEDAVRKHLSYPEMPAGLLGMEMTARRKHYLTAMTRRAKLLRDSMIVTAILDRLLHHSQVLNIRGESYRPKDKRQFRLPTPRRLLMTATNEQQEENIGRSISGVSFADMSQLRKTLSHRRRRNSWSFRPNNGKRAKNG